MRISLPLFVLRLYFLLVYTHILFVMQEHDSGIPKDNFQLKECVFAAI